MANTYFKIPVAVRGIIRDAKGYVRDILVTSSEVGSSEINDLSLSLGFRPGENLYIENVFTGSDLTQVNYWTDSGKGTKLFTKNIIYTLDNPTSIVLTDEITGKVLTTTIAYTGSEVYNVTKVVS